MEKFKLVCTCEQCGKRFTREYASEISRSNAIKRVKYCDKCATERRLAGQRSAGRRYRRREVKKALYAPRQDLWADIKELDKKCDEFFRKRGLQNKPEKFIIPKSKSASRDEAMAVAYGINAAKRYMEGVRNEQLPHGQSSKEEGDPLQPIQ